LRALLLQLAIPYFIRIVPILSRLPSHLTELTVMLPAPGYSLLQYGYVADVIMKQI
jgi:hypothetical protein